MIDMPFIQSWAAPKAFITAILLALSMPLLAHEGHDHEAATKPADVRLAPRFELRSEDFELVGVLAGKELIVYLDRAADNAPVPGAQIEIEGQGINGVATEMANGIYQLSVPPLTPAGKYPLTLTIQAGEIVDLLSANLEIGHVAAAVTDAGHPDRNWWFYAGTPLLLLAGGLIVRRLRRQPQPGIHSA
ncbi:carboxypeptidase-like regulatory domain-containing protein [Dechloromonas sp. A34]|uniref:carboxypeptidase-like regulatory domain-containing protein n=1 Tax=Dechloromonas sp. A34 TaxID=447588 RepID=UPI0022491C60|nr:hypothetical protein [Dechloromonas sp. A34]